jgi:hypothetical protein
VVVLHIRAVEARPGRSAAQAAAATAAASGDMATLQCHGVSGSSRR